MSVFPPKYRTKIYKAFKNIEEGEHHTMIRFYEEHEKVIEQLEDDQYFELMNYYLKSLFYVSAYRKFISKVDEAIEFCIIYNIDAFEGEDVFQHLLFKKAAAYYQLMEDEKAIHVLEELVKINPHIPIYQRFLRKCLRRHNPRLIQNTRALGIFLFLSAAIVICVEILFVRNFYKNAVDSVEFGRNLLFIAGVLFLAGGELFHRSRIYLNVNRFARLCKEKKD